MSKLEKGQNITKSAEEIAVELDGEIPMDAKLIGKYITKKQNSMKIKIENWRKVEKYGVLGESEKNRMRGGGRASKKKKNQRLRRILSQKHQRNMRLNQQKAKRASFRSPRGGETKK